MEKGFDQEERVRGKEFGDSDFHDWWGAPQAGTIAGQVYKNREIKKTPLQEKT
jgi:hypothetical protein